MSHRVLIGVVSLYLNVRVLMLPMTLTIIFRKFRIFGFRKFILGTLLIYLLVALTTALLVANDD